MHELYLHYVGCKANWQKSTLLIEIQKSNSTANVELWEWWTLEKMEEKLGTTLAEDLKQRHLAEEARLPAAKKGRFVRVSHSSTRFTICDVAVVAAVVV